MRRSPEEPESGLKAAVVVIASAPDLTPKDFGDHVPGLNPRDRPGAAEEITHGTVPCAVQARHRRRSYRPQHRPAHVVLGFTPWDGVTGPTYRQHLTGATFAASFSYLNPIYLFHGCTNLASVNGLGNLSGVRSMCHTFSSCAFTTIDFRGFDPSTLADLFYGFSGRNRLTTILADASRALPSSGITGSQRFYSCSTSPVGGNGTVWASNKTDCAYFRIDMASTPGYITAA